VNTRSFGSQLISEGKSWISTNQICGIHEDEDRYTSRKKIGLVTATKLGTTNDFFVAATKNFVAATKRFVDRTKHFVVTKYFCYPYFNK